MSEGQIILANNDSVEGREYMFLLIAQGIADEGKVLTFLDAFSERNFCGKNTAIRRANPARGLGDDRRDKLGVLELGQHADLPHDVEHAAQSGTDADLVKTQRLSGFVNENGQAAVRSTPPEGSITYVRIDDHGDTKRLGNFESFRIVEICSNLRQVGSVDCSGVQIDTVVGFGNDLLYEQVRER